MTRSHTDFVEAVRESNRTALSRLGSSKALYAETDGELDADTVLRAAATAEDAARETFEQWAATEADTAAADLFAALASQEAAHHETVVGKLDGSPSRADDDVAADETAGDDAPTVPAVQATLRGFDDTVGRAGGLVGRCLVARASKDQYTGYFVGDAAPQTASVFRELGGDVDDQLARAADLVVRVCAAEESRERAQEAATAAIQAAYSEYTTSLESMGINPKPVC